MISTASQQSRAQNWTGVMQLNLIVIFVFIAVVTAFPNYPICARNFPCTLLSTQFMKIQHRAAPSLSLKPIQNLRAGFFPGKESIVSSLEQALDSPVQTYNIGLLAIIGLVLSTKFGFAHKAGYADSAKDIKPTVVKALQVKFLSVFWLLRIADWLQGPYFFEVFHSKVFDGVPVTSDVVGKIFLLGFATTGFVGPYLGHLVDTVGRKSGTLLFTILYALSALSTGSNNLAVILAGRFAGGLGTSLLFSAPEAWLIGEHELSGTDGKWLGETFGWAFAGDAVVAIIAGQLATWAARRAGPTGPFQLSVAFLAVGALVATCMWEENTAYSVAQSVRLLKGNGTGNDSNSKVNAIETKKPSIRAALGEIVADKKILLLGAVQALFEGAMYLFVLQWPPLIQTAIHGSHFGPDANIPYGNVFSCFMASCLFGSTLFGKLQRSGVATEKSTAIMLTVATLALSVVTYLGSSHLVGLSLALFAFEACVGMYFPSIGSLRSKYLPDQHRAVMMNLFGIPLNLLVVSIVLGLKSLGTKGALGIASAALGVATVCMTWLDRIASEEKLKPLF